MFPSCLTRRPILTCTLTWLNVFVNVLTDDGTVRTVTLALVEIEAGGAGIISVLLRFVFTNINHIGVLHTTSLFRHCIRYFNAGLT